MRRLYTFIKKTISKSGEDDISKEAAALSFFGIFSLIPVLILLVFIASLFVEPVTVEQRFISFAIENFGQSAGRFTDSVLENFTSSSGSIPFFALTLGLTLYGAYWVFDHLRKTFFMIFKLHVRAASNVTKTVKLQGFAFFYMVLLFIAVYALLFVNAISQVVIQYVLVFLGKPFHLSPWMITHVKNAGVFILLVLLFSLIYRLVSLRHISWQASFLGAFVFSVMFWVGSALFDLYLSLSVTISFFGAASVVVAFMLWIYYMGVALFYSAEVAEVWFHDGNVPDDQKHKKEIEHKQRKRT